MRSTFSGWDVFRVHKTCEMFGRAKKEINIYIEAMPSASEKKLEENGFERR